MLKKIVLTGAAGNLGQQLRETLASMCEQLVSTDLQPVGETLANETFVQADIADLEAIVELSKGADQIVHFGAIADEQPLDVLWGPNFYGAYAVWEAAYCNGIKRVCYASSVHAVGMSPSNETVSTDTPHRPDTFYGLAKCFAEDLGRLYWEKRGVESVHMRIMSCTPEPGNARALGTWLSYADLKLMVKRAVEAPTTGWTVIWGVSNNTRCPVDTSAGRFLGYIPQDNAEDFADRFTPLPQHDPQDLQHMRIGGPFAVVPLGESGVSMIKKL